MKSDNDGNCKENSKNILKSRWEYPAHLALSLFEGVYSLCVTTVQYQKYFLQLKEFLQKRLLNF